MSKSTEKPKKAAKKEYTLVEKRSGRFAVLDKNGKYLHGDEKVGILLKEKKIKLSAPKKKEESAAAE